MKITQPMIRRVTGSVCKARLDEFCAACDMWLAHYGINTERRVAHFIAHLLHESVELNRLEENLNYSTAGLRKTFPRYFKTDAEAAAYAHNPQQIANRVYANRMGNDSEQSGDGWRYRGRGAIQLTGRSNYLNYKNSDLCIGDPVTNPDILTKFPEAYKSAMWFWQSNKLNELADRDNGVNTDYIHREITRHINGGENGLAQRAVYLRKLKKEFGIK